MDGSTVWKTWAATVAILVAGAGAEDAYAAKRLTAPKIEVLSNRADLVSGGDALVAITLPGRARGHKVDIRVGRRSVVRQFHRDGLRLRGLMTGLRVGRNVLTVRLKDGSGARLVLRNHPPGGPVFAGPQPQPWTCPAGAGDAACNRPPSYRFFYKPRDAEQLRAYDPAAPPDDVAVTTAENGTRMPFVVRVESGYQDRDHYQVAALFDPSRPWNWRAPQPQFAHKLLIPHGFGCDLSYAAATAPSVTTYKPANLPIVPDSAVWALGRGWAVMSTAKANNSHNCDVVTSAESLVMAKERVVEQYGTLRFTIGIGCSGGSLTQQWVANAYPGVYQGILPTCSFPDTWTAATQVVDYHLLRAYFENPGAWGPGIAWSPTQFAPVEGNDLPLNAITSDTGFYAAIVPTHACGGTTAQDRYDPASNPGGVRCSIADFAVNVFGRRPPEVWGPAERRIGRGFAAAPVDNVGVQYGLKALVDGAITAAQFVDLNQRVGGIDADGQVVAQRTAALPSALAAAYRSGMINETSNADQVPIIDCRGPDPGAAHDSFRAFTIRARLDREHGTHVNHLIWEGPYPLGADARCQQDGLEAENRWLSAVERDAAPGTVAQKVARNRPTDLTDRCYDGVGHKLADTRCPNAIVNAQGTPRMIAGDALTTDANKCRRKPLRREDYPVTFTDQQWTTLQQVFPTGVCDFTRPGVEQQPTVAWQTYQDANGNVITGGRPMGAAPTSKGFPGPRRGR